MSRSRKEAIILAVLLTAIFALSLALRTAVPWDKVFSGQWIKLTDNDAYYYLRLLDNISSHFPQLGQFDPYSIFPGGKDLAGQPMFFVYFMGFFTWLLGGSPAAQHTVDLVAAYFPAVMGALMVFPVFFIGRAAFNKWAGLTAALFIALIPGEFLVRTLLGNTDIHVMEIFFSTLFMLFLLTATLAGRGIAINEVQKTGFRPLIRTAVFSILAGLCLGIYLLSWQGALFFILISFTWLVIQVIINHLRGIPSGHLGLTGCTVYLTALLMTAFTIPGLMVQLSLAVAIAASAALPLLSWSFQKRSFKPFYFPAAAAALAGLAVLAIYIYSPPLLRNMASTLAGFFMWRPEVTIAEAQPLLINQGSFTLALLWGNYTAGSVMALAALGIIIYQSVKKGTPGVTMLAVWSIFTLLAALAMRRFAYYFAVNAALLSGYTGWLIMRACGWKEKPETAPQVAPTGRKKNRPRTAGAKAVKANPALLSLGAVAVLLLAVYPNTGPLPGGDRPFFDVATRALFTPSNAWCESLDWMRKNTPEPFGNAEYYYEYYQPGSRSNSTLKPAYSVVCWWDYGYWVTRLGHRVPFSNPASAQLGEQVFFMAQDAAEADSTKARQGMKYVIVNDYLADWTRGFGTVAYDAGQPASRYYEIYYRSQNGKLSPTLLYYPEYYKTMAVRLYCFDGKEYAPAETAVISWEQKTGSDGRPYKEITGLKTTRIYEDAVKFVAMQDSGNWRIVGKDPTASPVPLEGLDNYRLVYASSQKSTLGTAQVPEVKIFEYTGLP